MIDKKDRENNYDILRIISAIMVILIHVNAYFSLQEDTIMRGSRLIEILFDFLPRFSVPCFVMLSGAFILEKKETTNVIKFYRKAVYKILLPYIYISIFWIIVMKINPNNGWKEIGKQIIKGTYGNLWFVSMILGIYILAPVIVKIKNNCEQRYWGGGRNAVTNMGNYF